MSTFYVIKHDFKAGGAAKWGAKVCAAPATELSRLHSCYGGDAACYSALLKLFAALAQSQEVMADQAGMAEFTKKCAEAGFFNHTFMMTSPEGPNYCIWESKVCFICLVLAISVQNAHMVTRCTVPRRARLPPTCRTSSMARWARTLAPTL